ncbi:hypothetical protein NDU88_003684 [Pleurodeles waltl]|uniref:Uncharacterized protein n=1 Tax=Pleurodeles waltl TaxID=8319 RepID=A0AAV7VEW0_PLEWA|nr:hypothetical protein NDU88_003684 [Pleurodeles waltl]
MCCFARDGFFPFPFGFPRLLLATGSLLSPVISNSCPPTCHKLKEGWGGAELFSSSRALPEAPAPATFSLALLGTSKEARITALPSSRGVFPGALPVLAFPGFPGGAPVRHVPSAGVSRRVPRPDYSASGSPGMALPPNTFGRSSPRECHAPQVRQTSRLSSCGHDGPNAARHVLPFLFVVALKIVAKPVKT